MTAYYIGGMSIGVALPAASVAADAGADGINAAFPDIAARLTALTQAIAALATMPPLPSFLDMKARAAANLAGLEVAIVMPGLPDPPTLSTAIAALSALVADLTVMVSALNLKLDLIVDFQTLLATEGVHVITYDGPRSNVGIDVQGQVNAHVPGGPDTATWGITLITADGATRAALTQVFKVDP